MRQIIDGFMRMDAGQILAAGAMASLIGVAVLCLGKIIESAVVLWANMAVERDRNLTKPQDMKGPKHG